MFIHGKTNKIYYSVREKIKYYNDIISGKKSASPETKRKAKLRVKSLNKINSQSYSEPVLIITDDKHFGNGVSKPRLCVAFAEATKNRIMVAPINRRSSKSIILDKQPGRQINPPVKCIDKSDVYETKYLSNVYSLTKYDKAKIKEIYKKK